MFEHLEIRKVANGFVLAVTNEEGETVEFIYDTPRKLMNAIRQHVAAQ